MFFGGINFALHSQIVRGNFAGALKNPEFRSYCSILIIGILLATWGLTRVSPDGHAGEAFRNAAFTVVSIQTTTGFVTDDFNLWPEYLKLLILGIMMVGGCSGSTSGSFKIIRFIILIKIILRELAKLVHPRATPQAKRTQIIVPLRSRLALGSSLIRFFQARRPALCLLSSR